MFILFLELPQNIPTKKLGLRQSPASKHISTNTIGPRHKPSVLDQLQLTFLLSFLKSIFNSREKICTYPQKVQC